MKLDNLFFALVAAIIIMYCGWLGIQGVLLAHDRIAQEIARVAQ